MSDGPPRAFEVPENTRDQPERPDSGAAMSVPPKPYFSHSQNHNGRTRNHPRPINYEMTPYHKESANFLLQNWQKTMREYERFSSKDLKEGPEFYRPRESNPELDSFKKFDLEEYWGNRTMRRLTESS